MSSTLSKFIDEHVEQVDPLFKGANLAYWDFTTTGNQETVDKYARLQAELRLVHANRERYQLLQTLRSEDDGRDPLLTRQATLLQLAFEGNQMDRDLLEEITQREVAIEGVFNTFRAELEGKRVTNNELADILRDSDDLGVRRQAWEASKQIGPLVADNLLELVEIRNRVARQIGHSNFYSMQLALQELDENEMFSIFDDLDRQLRPAYADYKADLDARLAENFGVAVSDLRPWHYSDPFFQNSPMADPKLREYLDSALGSQDIEGITRRFYEVIGLDVADVLERSDLYEREGKQQHAYCIHMDRCGDVRVLCNIRPNYDWMATMLHEFGHAAYDKYLDPDLPYLLREPAHMLSTEAVAMLMGRLGADPTWLVEYTGARVDGGSSIGVGLKNLQRSELLIMSRWVPVMCHFERALYSNPEQDLNRLWWDLVERFQMMQRPEDRDMPDWAAKIHLSTVPVYYHNYLLGELMASQLRHTIDVQVLGGGEDVDLGFVTDPVVGEYMIEKVFRPGARRHWQDGLEYATGERLRPKYFVEQVS